METKCPACGTKSDLALPLAVSQPVLDQLRFANPETLAMCLHQGEEVLVQCHANIGGLVGTNLRMIVIKDGNSYGYAYNDLRDIAIEKVGWWLYATCQITTAKRDYARITSREADRAPNAVSLLRRNMGLFEAAKARLLGIQKDRACPHCGKFVPITSDELAALSARGYVMDPVPAEGVAVLVANLLPDEVILCQIHAERYYKTMVVTDQRVMIVLGSDPKRFHAYPLGDIEGVELTPELLQLHVRGRKHAAPRGTVGRVGAEDSILCDESDLPRLNGAATLVQGLIKPQPAPADVQR